jgi:hypothetical protein
MRVKNHHIPATIRVEMALRESKMRKKCYNLFYLSKFLSHTNNAISKIPLFVSILRVFNMPGFLKAVFLNLLAFYSCFLGDIEISFEFRLIDCILENVTSSSKKVFKSRYRNAYRRLRNTVLKGRPDITF